MKSRKVQVIALVLLLLLANLCWHVYRFAPEYPIGDQWGLWAPLLNRFSLTEGFLHQHGSHFLGVGYLVSAATAYISGYYVPAESYVTVVLMACNAILAVRLKAEMRGKVQYMDLIIPTLFLNPMLVEVFLWKAHPSVAALPVMSALLLGHLILSKDSPSKGLLVGLLGVLSAFTGYAFLVSGLCLLYSFYLLWRSRYRGWILISLAMQVSGILLFGARYTFPEGTVCGLSWGEGNYLGYIFTMVFHFFGGVALKSTTLIALAVGIGGPFLYTMIRGNLKLRSSVVVANAALGLFSIAYILLNTYSRSCMGAEMARAPRYSVFLMPLFLAIFHMVVLALRNKTGWQRFIPILFVVTFLVFRFKTNTGYRNHVAETSKAYGQWRECYEKTGEVESCSELTGQYPFYTLNNQQAKERWVKFEELQAGVRGLP